MKKTLLLTALMLLSPAIYAATLKSMNKAQLEKSFLNRTLTSIGVDNLNGKTVDNSNAVFLDLNGRVYGKMGYKPKNQPQLDQGVYRISDNGTVYITWKHWDNAKTLCFHIFETKNAFLTVDCNNVYHSTFMKSDIQPGNHLV